MFDYVHGRFVPSTRPADAPHDPRSTVTHIDPSWCARINAHRHPSPEPPASAAPADDASATEREIADSSASPSTYGSPFRLREVPKEHVCECCGTVMFDHNCKIVCPNCGYKRDCSDP